MQQLFCRISTGDLRSFNIEEIKVASVVAARFTRHLQQRFMVALHKDVLAKARIHIKTIASEYGVQPGVETREVI